MHNKSPLARLRDATLQAHGRGDGKVTVELNTWHHEAQKGDVDNGVDVP